MNVDDAGRLAGAHAWWEQRCFEILGRWVPEAADPAVKAALDRHSAHAAWRAAQWADRLPVRAGLDRWGLVVAPDQASAALVDAMPATEGTVARLAAAYRVLLARRAVAYRSHLEGSSPVSDGPARRTLAMVIADVGADWAEGETLLEGRLVSGPAVVEAAASVGRLEAILAPHQGNEPVANGESDSSCGSNVPIIGGSPPSAPSP